MRSALTTTIRDGIGVAIGCLLTGVAVYGYLWQLLIETSPPWGPVESTPSAHLFGLGLFIGEIVLAYVSFMRGLNRVITDVSDS